MAGFEPSPRDRIESFMHEETDIDGVPVRVVELTGEPGDMVFCHPCVLHCAAPNCGDHPRFMRIAGLMTRQGLRLRSRYRGPWARASRQEPWKPSGTR